MFSNVSVPVNLALCYLSVLTCDPSPWLPAPAMLPPVTHERSCLRPLLCLFLLRNIFPPGIGMAHFLTICLTITLLMRISLTFLTPYHILYRYLYFLYLIFPHRTQHFPTCHLLHCLLQVEYKWQQDKHFCLFSYCCYLQHPGQRLAQRRYSLNIW